MGRGRGCAGGPILLAALPADADAATLAGAVLAAGEHHLLRIAAEPDRLASAVAVVRARWGVGPTESAMAAGAAFDHAEGVAYVRRAIGREPPPW
jgi:hypothetical protein